MSTAKAQKRHYDKWYKADNAHDAILTAQAAVNKVVTARPDTDDINAYMAWQRTYNDAAHRMKAAQDRVKKKDSYTPHISIIQ
jgi:hypothetical protein